jgi:hypothetical protein
VHIHIWILGWQPVQGQASAEGREPIPFEGWLDLLERLAEIASSPPDEQTAEGE